ncbi:MAG: abortive infection system antitoxin AbiGi family protein [Bacteriovoracaceae bacterium]|jgi:hypothetical protein|nr:abortive infection system antitoxin AbiGi family protein [Bacteriovoracaceae bacterium]
MKYNKNWEDMSEFLIHFAKGPDQDSAYNAIMGILFDQQIKVMNPFGFAKKYATDKENQKSVCLSETPLHLLERISQRRGPYGIGFTKSFITSKGGNPILYAQANGPLFEGLEKLTHISLSQGGELEESFWKIAPFIDQVISKPNKRYQFDWEREWRINENLNFKVTDVEFLIIPEDLHEAAEGFFLDAEVDNTGPSYKCPLIDIHWSLDKIRNTLSK